jgi:diacylglycerol kinase
MICLVFILEMINTIVERLLDVLKPRLHEYVKDIKDIMSAMVLISALSSVAVGLIIFLPYL